MKNLLWICLVFISIIVLEFGCSFPVKLEIFNNTQEDINLKSGSSSEFLKIKKGQKILVLYPAMLIVKRNNIEYKYPIIISKEFIKSPLFSTRRIYCQIEPDGKIYILENGDLPAKIFPKQPEGYPLIPLVKDE